MQLELDGVRLPLAEFPLSVTATLSRQVTGVFGASGSGKTSLLELIAGLRRPAAGRIRLDNVVLSDASSGEFIRPEARAIGYVPQEGALFPHFSVRQNLLYGRPRSVARKSGGRSTDPLTFDHVVEVLEIGPLAERRIQTLSGGEKQRVALGRALLGAPRLLLLDEPLGSLDAPLRDRLLPYFSRLRSEFGIPMIYVSHAPEEIMALCDDVLVLASGSVEARGIPQSLFVASTQPRYVRRSAPGNGAG